MLLQGPILLPYPNEACQDRQQQHASSLQVKDRHNRQTTANTGQATSTPQHSTRLQQLLQLQAERRAAARKQHADQGSNEVSDTEGQKQQCLFMSLRLML
jgi:hypothetical protein